MSNLKVKKRFFGESNYQTSDIFDENNNRIYPQLSRFIGMIGPDSIDGYIKEISEYTFDPETGQDDIPEEDLINDYVLRGVSGKPDILHFVNYNIDEDFEEISKVDLLDIFQQWKNILCIKDK